MRLALGTEKQLMDTLLGVDSLNLIKIFSDENFRVYEIEVGEVADGLDKLDTLVNSLIMFNKMLAKSK